MIKGTKLSVTETPPGHYSVEIAEGVRIRWCSAGGRWQVRIESDTGLTLAVLRQAQRGAVRGRIANVADAVVALGPIAIEEAIRVLPRAEFPWRAAIKAMSSLLLRHRRSSMILRPALFFCAALPVAFPHGVVVWEMSSLAHTSGISR